MKIDRITPEDLSSVAELEALCFAEPWSASALALLCDDRGAGVVAREDEGIVAYGGVFWAPDEGQITNIAVHPTRRRRGLGNAILEALIALARERGCAEISLEVRASNSAAVTLYEKHGFRIMGRRKGFYRKPCEDALVMILSLGEITKER